VGKREKALTLSTVQQEPKHWCVTNNVLATNLKHSIIQAAMKKLTSSPARPRSSVLDPTDLIQNKESSP